MAGLPSWLAGQVVSLTGTAVHVDADGSAGLDF